MEPPYFDRWDICAAYWVFSRDYAPLPAIESQLNRMQYKPGHSLREYLFRGLSNNGKLIYWRLVKRYGF